MAESFRYSLEITRVDVNGIRKRSKKGQLCLEIKISNAQYKRVDIGKDGQITSDATLLFSQSTPPSTFVLSIKEARKGSDDHLLGHIEIKEDVQALLQKSLPYEFKGDLTRTTRSLFGADRAVVAGVVHFDLNLADTWERAELCVSMAEQRVTDMADKATCTDGVIRAVIQAVDQMKDVLDTVAEIHPIINLSWKAVSALYTVCCSQLETDARVVGLVDKMKDAFHFSNGARVLNDRTELLKPKLKSLLELTAECSRFLQGYAQRSFTGRLVKWSGSEEVDEYTARFEDLRRSLDSDIMVNINKGLDDIESTRILETLVDPTKIDISRMTDRDRCLDGTRKSYLNTIMSILLPDPNGEATVSRTDKRIVWLTGAAGAGKSTIALTVARACGSKGSPAAYLFFERGKDEYFSAVRAIAYRLAMLYPSIRPFIVDAVKSADANFVGESPEIQFQRLVLDPILAAAVGQPIIIILDALDECGTTSQRAKLVGLLMNDFAKLPSIVRTLITSRPEMDIPENQSQFPSHIHHVRLEHQIDESRHDVHLYIKASLPTAVKQGPPQGWTWERVCGQLSEAADGLFIWASTMIKMVDSRRKLGMLLRDVKSVGGGIDNLYVTVLEQSGIFWQRAESKDEFVRILGVVLFSKEVLSGEDIEALLGLDQDAVDDVLGRLRSVLFYEPGKPVHLHHASFADYLISERSVGKPWHIDETTQRQLIAERCFATMETKLHFNMCDLESSFVRNDDVCDLADRVESRIPAYLRYACLHWAQHLIDTPCSSELLGMLSDFANERLLFWFEVLSLTRLFGRYATETLSAASEWSEPRDANISSFLQDARKLASMFTSPIMDSTPHIYVSMIPLMGGDSEAAAHYAKRVSSTVRIDRIGLKRPPLCLKSLNGHRNPVQSIAFAPNGKRLTSASGDDITKVWDVDSGEEIFALKGCVVCFSPDGDRTATGSKDGTLRVWDAINGQLVFGPLEGHTEEVFSVAWSPDGSRIASGSGDWTVIIWDREGKAISRLKGHENWVTSVAFSPDSANLASGSYDNTIRIWDVKSGKLALKPIDAKSYVRSVVFSPSGIHLAAACGGVIDVWEVENGNLISTLKGHTSFVASVAYFDCGTRIVSGSWDKTIKVWDVESGNTISSLQGHTKVVTSVSISRDGKYIASGSGNKTIRIWDTTATTSISKLSAKHSDRVTPCVSISPGGARVASASRDGSIIIWDLETGNVALGPLLGHENWVTCLTFTPDGSRLLSGSYDKTVSIWDAETGEVVMDPLRHAESVLCIAVSPDSKTVASGSGDSISIWSVASGQLIAGPLRCQSSWVFSIAFSPDGKRLVSGSNDKTIKIWNTHSWEAMSQLIDRSPCMSVCFSSDGTRIASYSYDGSITIWDTESGQKVAGLFRGRVSRAGSVVYLPDGRHVISSSEDNTIRVWNVESGETVCKLEGHSDPVKSLAISPDGLRLVSGSWDNTIRIWDTSNIAQPSAENVDLVSTVSSAWVLERDGWVLSGRDQRDLLLWIPPDLRNTLRRPHNTAVMGCDFSTKLDFMGAAIGGRWTECFALQSRNTA